MQNKANFRKSQMFITAVSTTNYNEKMKLDTWSKRTQTNPIYGELVEPTCSELVKPITKLGMTQGPEVIDRQCYFC
jgi:hypothetical protein